MLFFIPLCDDYPPVILPSFGPFMLTLGTYMLVLRCYAREQSNFQLLAVSLNVILIPTYVFSRQTSCVLGCGVYGLHLTPHTTGGPLGT